MPSRMKLFSCSRAPFTYGRPVPKVFWAAWNPNRFGVTTPGAAINVFGGDAGAIDGRSSVINYRDRNAGGVLLRNSRLHGSAEEEGEKQAERDCSSRPALFALPNTPYGEAGIGVERGFRDRPG